jgi:galactokinase
VYVECSTLHSGEYGSEPDLVASAPGVLHLLGEHLDYTRGRVMSLALAQRAWVTISPTRDNYVRIFAADYKERKKFSASNLKFKKEDRWANLLKGVLAGLANLGCQISGLNITIHSEIPEGRGLGASSAISIAAIVALLRLYHFSLRPEQIVYLANTAETQFMGRLCNVASCFVSYHAHAGAVFFLDIRDHDYRHLRLSQGEYAFWVIDTKVNPQGFREEQIERRERYEELKQSLKPRCHGKDLRDFAVRDARELLDGCAEPLRHLGNFIIDEENRLVMAEDTVEASNIPPLGKILSRSHYHLSEIYDVSCPELDWLARHSLEVAGVLGARLTGRGFGGMLVLLVQGEFNPQELLLEYERIFGFTPRMFRAVPSHKAQIHTLKAKES